MFKKIRQYLSKVEKALYERGLEETIRKYAKEAGIPPEKLLVEVKTNDEEIYKIDAPIKYKSELEKLIKLLENDPVSKSTHKPIRIEY